MTKSSDHHLVRKYLRQFDASAAGLPPVRRAVLREDILAHLRDAISDEMSDADIAAIISHLGSPAEIISEEIGTASRRRDESRHRTDWATIVLILLAVMAGALALIVMLPSAISYLTVPGLIFSAFVWSLGGVLVVFCLACIVGARLRSRR